MFNIWYRFIRNSWTSTRGGYTFVGAESYVQVNINNLQGYDEAIASTYLLYVDTNNFHVYAMCHHLPYSDIKINNDKAVDDVIHTSYDSNIGYMVEVDIYIYIYIYHFLNQYKNY